MTSTLHQANEASSERKSPFRRVLGILGPGLITGAADNDPSGIATYTQAGAPFGYGQIWTALYMLPLMTAVQEACGRIGTVTGQGIAATVRDHYGKKVLYPLVVLVLVANVINIGADIGAMGAAVRLLIPIPFTAAAILFTALILALQVFTSYQDYAKVLKWLALALLAYPLTVVIVSQPWGTLLRSTVVSHIAFSSVFLFLITGVPGTTISPYMFIWQASQEVEELAGEHRLRRHAKPRISWAFVRRVRTDTKIGMIASEITTWSILVVGATVLHAHGKTNVATAADAVKALESLLATALLYREDRGQPGNHGKISQRLAFQRIGLADVWRHGASRARDVRDVLNLVNVWRSMQQTAAPPAPRSASGRCRHPCGRPRGT